MWECPKCGESMHDYDDHCWNCKTPNPLLPGSESADKPGLEPESGSSHGTAHPSRPMKKCQYCAEEILAEAIKCRYCGSAVLGSGENGLLVDVKVKGGADSKISKKPITIALISIAVFAAICVALALVKPACDFVSSRITSTKSPAERGVAYEEITEYDGKGNVTKSVKTYPKEKAK